MLKKTITYTDYDNVKRTEDFYFNLTMAELQEKELTTTGGYAALLRKIVDEKNVPEIYKLFKSVILDSYGIKSADGRRFIKKIFNYFFIILTHSYSFHCLSHFTIDTNLFQVSLKSHQKGCMFRHRFRLRLQYGHRLDRC